MPRGNPSSKLAITPEIHEKVLATAAREALRRRAALAALGQWEKEHGGFTAEEMNEARRNVRAQLRISRTEPWFLQTTQPA